MVKILPILLAILGLGGGVGAGIAFRPEPAELVMTNPCGDAIAEHLVATGDGEVSGEASTGTPDYVKLNNQFVVPVVKNGLVRSLVVMSLSLELNSGGPELVYQREPKLRDAFLQVLFDHANNGGFDGNFTSGRNMDNLRRALRESATTALGTDVSSVLIVDVVRQDA